MPALIESFKDGSDTVRNLAATALAQFGSEAVPKLTEAMKSPTAQVRRHAAYSLGQIGRFARDAVPTLTAALKDADAEVRRQAAFALSQVTR